MLTAHAYRINDAARLLGIGRTSLYRLLTEGKLKAIRIAGRVVIPRAEVERLLEEAHHG